MLRVGMSICAAVIAAIFAADCAEAAAPKVLYSFTGGADGANPSGNLLLDSAGNLYGTTQTGGTGCPSAGCGTVFMLAPDGSKTVLHAFTGGATDGQKPVDAGLVMDSAGNLYGTTEWGGLGGPADCFSSGCGTVFKIAPNGTETILHFFAPNTSDGVEPTSGLLLDKRGNLYGAAYGGANSAGIVFKIASNGTYTILHTFTGGADGYSPNGQLVIDKAGNLYGTTMAGGGAGCSGGCGTVYEIARNGTHSVLYAFQGGASDGADPYGGLIRDSAGTLYGTTAYGGTCASIPAGCGVTFKLSAGTESVLHIFQGGASDGAQPATTLSQDKLGNLTGTTVLGGVGCRNGCGAIFQIAPDGTETILSDMGNKVGDQPESGIIRDHKGNLYGTTFNGKKSAQYGTIFRFKP